MGSNFLVGFLMVIMKHFFDIEKEITQQILATMIIRIHDCKEFITNIHGALIHKF